MEGILWKNKRSLVAERDGEGKGSGKWRQSGETPMHPDTHSTLIRCSGLAQQGEPSPSLSDRAGRYRRKSMREEKAGHETAIETKLVHSEDRREGSFKLQGLEPARFVTREPEREGQWEKKWKVLIVIALA